MVTRYVSFNTETPTRAGRSGFQCAESETVTLAHLLGDMSAFPTRSNCGVTCGAQSRPRLALCFRRLALSDAPCSRREPLRRLHGRHRVPPFAGATVGDDARLAISD